MERRPRRVARASAPAAASDSQTAVLSFLAPHVPFATTRMSVLL